MNRVIMRYSFVTFMLSKDTFPWFPEFSLGCKIEKKEKKLHVFLQKDYMVLGKTEELDFVTSDVCFKCLSLTSVVMFTF